jgi:hypothetical protein
MHRTVVTKRFDYSTPPNQTDISGPSHLSPADWRRIERLLKAAVQEGTTEVVQKLTGAIHRASTENKLLKLQNEGQLASLDTQNKRKRNSWRLPLKGKKKQRTNATIFTPREVQEAREVQCRKDDEKLEKAAQIKDNKKANKKKKEVKEARAAEARAERDRNKRVKDQEKADKLAEKQAERERKNNEKALQTSQKGKCKAKKCLASKPTKKRRIQPRSGRTGAVGVQEVPSEQPARMSRGARTITVPLKYR